MLSRWPNADEILDQALARPPGERRAFVRRAAGGDEALVAALDAVLDEAERGDDDFLTVGGAMAGAVAGDLARAEAVVDDAAAASAPRLARGQRFGVYDVAGTIGSGGMGEVYRARDTRLGRDVALKVLPTRVATNPDSHVRFEREARLLASLNHPHIAAIYGFEEHDGVAALVLELVNGPTLAERLRRGPMPIEEAIDVAIEIAAALEAAHRRGVVHRDLKPSNIKLSDDGDVKVLDFGIAKALDADRAGERLAADAPTLAATAGVRPGGVLGTASYVSPERARGRTADHRSDIWAFACVMFELLTGERAFGGETTTEVVARVLEREPDLSKLPARTPPSLRRLLERGFRKDPDRRLGHIGDARLDLEDARAELGQPPALEMTERSGGRVAFVAALGALVLGLGLGAVAVWQLRASPAPSVSYLSVPVPDEDNLVAGELPGLALSPDGRTIVYRAWRNGVIQLVQRSFDDETTTVLPGSEGGADPFFSPDGRWIAFTGEARLMKVPTAGGDPTALADAPGGARGSWADDGFIYYSVGTRRGIFRVPETGGAAETVATIDETAGHLAYDAPAVLPGARAAFVTVVAADGQRMGVMHLDTGAVSPLDDGRQARYLPGGIVVFVRGTSLFAARFDLDRLVFTTAAVEVVSDVEVGALNGTAQFAVSDGGTLAYLPLKPDAELRTPAWVTRSGEETVIPIAPRNFTRASLSPDGTRLAVALSSPDNRDIWVYDLPPRQTSIRLTVDPAIDTAPIWSADGRWIAFRSERDGGGVFVMPSDGAADARRLTRSDGPDRPAHTPYAFTPDGRTLLFTELRSYSDQGIGAVEVDDPGSVRMLVDGPYAETRPAVSPDGRWMAYQSDETGRYEIYVRPFPDVSAGRVPVSTGGGTSPRWSQDGREILFHDGSHMVSAAVRPTATGLEVTSTTVLFEASRFFERLGPVYDVAPDGRRLLFLRRGGPDGTPDRRTDLRLVQHWIERVKERLAR